MDRLKQVLDELIAELPDPEELEAELENLISVYPFNEYEYIISNLFGKGKLDLSRYRELRDEYIARNLFLYLFEISAPRGFGEIWAQGHLKELVQELEKPSRRLDPDYSGQYDFLLDGNIRVEVKASRAVAFQTNAPLYVKALSSDSREQFDMNFQQIKPALCDVFVWIGVWRDVIRHWVLAAREVEASRYFSRGQHRGNVGEGQLHLNRDNLSEFEEYEVGGRDLLTKIREAYARQRGRLR